MNFETLVKTYGAIGAGGVALLVLLWVLVHLVTKIDPLLQTLKEQNGVHTEIIRNNTEAIKEVSKSNDNVATALQLLNQSFSSFTKLMEKHDTRAELIENEMIKIGTKMENCPNNKK